MLITLAGIVMELKLVTCLNALSPMLANRDPASNVTELKLVIPKNAEIPMLLTLAGIVMELKPVLRNACSPMLAN